MQENDRTATQEITVNMMGPNGCNWYGEECWAWVSPWSIQTAGIHPNAILAGFLQHSHCNNPVFPCLLWFQVTHTPTASPSLMSQVRGSKLQATYGTSCCPRNPASWLLAKWTENCGLTRLTRRKSPELVFIAGEEISSVLPRLSSRLIPPCQCCLKLVNKAQKLL